MILFKPEHVAPILEGRKTQTRRLGEKRWNVGAIHQARLQLFKGDPFAHLRILEVYRHCLTDISEDEALAEGYASPLKFLAAWERINGHIDTGAHEPVWAVRFELAEPPQGGE